MTASVPPSRALVVGALTLQLSALTLGALKPRMQDFKLLRSLEAGGVPDADQIDAMVRLVHASASIKDPALPLAAVNDAFAALPFLEALELLGTAFTVVTDLSMPPKMAGEGEGAGSGEAPKQ